MAELALSCSDVWKVFRSGRVIVKAVQGVSLTVQKGQIVCVRGPSGSGKSTLLSLLGALDTPTKGEVFGLGMRYVDLTMFELSRLRRNHYGFVFQELSLIPHLTAAENAVAPRMFEGISQRELREQSSCLLEKVGLLHRASHYPRELSYGERQRVAIARALSNAPAIVFADEPSANLDNGNVERLVEVFKELQRGGTTIVVATHDVRLEGMAAQILSMNDGILY